MEFNTQKAGCDDLPVQRFAVIVKVIYQPFVLNIRFLAGRKRCF